MTNLTLKSKLTKSSRTKSVTITPTRSVIEGWNGTIAGVRALAASLERSDRTFLADLEAESIRQCKLGNVASNFPLQIKSLVTD